MVINSLTPGGFLIIGSHEKLPFEVSDLKPWEESTIIFQKKYENMKKIVIPIKAVILLLAGYKLFFPWTAARNPEPGTRCTSSPPFAMTCG